MNQLAWPQRAEIKRLLAAGASLRTIAVVIPCSKATVLRYSKLWTFSVRCVCGRPAGHKAWCKARLEFSPKRRGWLVEKWGKRAGSDKAVTIDRAYREAAALGHQLGRFVWGSSGTGPITYALCSVCGKSAKLTSTYVIEGTALRDGCFTAEEHAAQKAAFQEKKAWRSARRTVTEIRRLLHPRGSRTAGSSQEPTSHA